MTTTENHPLPLTEALRGYTDERRDDLEITFDVPNPPSRTGRIELPVVDSTHDLVTVLWEIGLKEYSTADQPRWSFTAEVYEGALCIESRLITAGSLGYQLAAMWPVYFTRFHELHLSTIEGEPLHAVDNGLFYLGLTPHSKGRRLDAVARHFRISMEEAEDLGALCDRAISLGNNARPIVEWFVEYSRLRWQGEARAALRTLMYEDLPGSKRAK